MKLGELKSIIRTRKGNPDVMVQIGATLLPITVQKTSLLKALDEAYPGGRNAETGLGLSDDGLLVNEGAPLNLQTAPASEAKSTDDLDALDDLESLDEIDEL